MRFMMGELCKYAKGPIDCDSEEAGICRKTKLYLLCPNYLESKEGLEEDGKQIKLPEEGFS